MLRDEWEATQPHQCRAMGKLISSAHAQHLANTVTLLLAQE